MSNKPSYLGLLNAIAVGEARGHELLSAWARRTPDEQLARVLSFVAVREKAHASEFTKRMSELGFQVRSSPNGRFEQELELAKSNAPDAEKFSKILEFPDARQSSDALNRLFDDQTIDPETGELLGRYIAEERDSLNRLHVAYTCGYSQEEGTKLEAKAETANAVLNDIIIRLDKLSATLEALKGTQR